MKTLGGVIDDLDRLGCCYDLTSTSEGVSLVVSHGPELLMQRVAHLEGDADDIVRQYCNACAELEDEHGPLEPDVDWDAGNRSSVQTLALFMPGVGGDA